MKLTVIYMNRDGAEFNLQTNFRFDPCYRRITLDLTDEQIKKLEMKDREMLSCVFFEERESE